MNQELRERLRLELDSMLDRPYDPQTPLLLDLYFSFRLLLQRNPECSEVGWFENLIGDHTIQSLVRAVMGSHEYQTLAQFEPIPGEPIEVSTTLPSGLNFHFYLQDRDVGVSVARGVYEPNLLAAVEQAVEPGAVCIDAGANSGIFSLIMARRAAPNGGKVYSFEPFPRVFYLLRRNVETNGFQDTILTFSQALSDRCGLTPMYFPVNAGLTNFGTMFITREPGLPITRLANFDTNFNAIEVERVLADNLIPAQERVSVVKMDVEGSELAALDGMKRILQRDKPILFVEFNPWCLLQNGAVQPEVLLQRLRGYGYELIELDAYVNGTRTPFQYNPEAQIPLYNLVCLPPK